MRALRDERALLLAALIALAALAWVDLWLGAGMGMPARDMTVMSLFPHLQADPQGAPQAAWLLVGMWFVMMLAMMTPAALPLLLLGGRVMRHHGQAAAWRSAAPFIVAGYLACWGFFAVVAGLVQVALEPAGVVSPMLMWSRSSVFSAAVLLLAGLYQLSPLKDACLSKCRAPAAFLQQHWRAGRLGAFRLGLHHGAYCVGCCWLLMALLFVFGVMNVIWIALLSILVLAEKLTRGRLLARASGALLLVWAAATLAMPAQPAMQGMPGMPGMAASQDAMSAYTRAKVVGIDHAKHTIVLDHGEIPNLGMPPMAMEFHAREPKLLEQLKAGDAVRFRASMEAGQYMLTHIERER